MKEFFTYMYIELMFVNLMKKLKATHFNLKFN